MQTLAKAVTRSGLMGAPLPDVYNNLTKMGVTFRHGATSMIAGPPGAYKSTFALNLMTRWADRGATSVYISADSDQFTVGKRCAGILTGDAMDKVEKTLRDGSYTAALRRLSDVQWEFESLDLRSIQVRLLAFEQKYGHFPDVLFLDNLMNMLDNPADFQGQIKMCLNLDKLARETKTHICILHHTSETYRGSEPPPRAAIQGKVSQFPRLILTMNAVGPDMMVAVVKNTNGPAQADGKFYTDFLIDTPTARVMEMEMNQG
jgi:hypothetical protein